jgi:predicted flavoprotein YhiN
VPEARNRIGGRILTRRHAQSTVPIELGAELFFAGEVADAEGATGTVHAALATGHRAAGQVARALVR